MKTWEAKHSGQQNADFKFQLLSDPEITRHISKEELEALCNLDFHFKEVDKRFQQLGLSA
jgi:hypothetical protein